MADNVQISAGSGTTIATDEVSDVHYQFVKLASGTLGETAVIPGDATNGLDVDVTRLPSLVAGTALIGKVGIDQVSANANEVVIKSGTVTAVTAITNALPAGTALIGKVSIDQSTANANEVVIKSGTVTAVTGITNALPAGTNNIGDVDIASAIPAGTNNIGDVDIASIAAGDNNIGNVDIATIAAGDNNIGNVDIASIAAGTNNIGKVDSPITTPTCYNVTLTNADTEYNQALPENTRYVEFQCLTAFAVRFAFATGKVATPTAPYMTLKANDYYTSPVMYQAASPGTLYLASSQAGVIVQILAWT